MILKILNFQTLLQIKINKISLVKLYDIINTAITTPLYILQGFVLVAFFREIALVIPSFKLTVLKSIVQSTFIEDQYFVNANVNNILYGMILHKYLMLYRLSNPYMRN